MRAAASQITAALGRRPEQIKTPTDAKRPAGVISLIGGYGGTPSHKSFDFSGGAKLGKR
jgi:hypothetical protein